MTTLRRSRLGDAPDPTAVSDEAIAAGALQTRWEELNRYFATVASDVAGSVYLAKNLGAVTEEIGALLNEAQTRLNQPIPATDRAAYIATIQNIIDGAEWKMQRVMTALDHYDRFGYVRGSWLPALAVTGLYFGLLYLAQKGTGFSVIDEKTGKLEEVSEEEFERLAATGDYELKDIEDCGCTG